MTDLDPRVRRRLADLLDHTQLAASLVARGPIAYNTDVMLRLASESLLIRMGETVDRIDKADPLFVNQHPDLELRRLKDTRNLVAHGYDIVDYEIIWTILETNIPAVASKVEELLNQSD